MVKNTTTVLVIFFIGPPKVLLCQPYKNSGLSIVDRVSDLLSRMTLDEKVSQLRSSYSAYPKINDDFLDDSYELDSLFGKEIGMINPDFNNTLEQSIAFRNKIQSYLWTRTRLGSPDIFIEEAYHGLLAT